jgi:TonB family protein
MRLVKFIGIAVILHSIILLFDAPEIKKTSKSKHIVVNYIGKSSAKSKQETKPKRKEKDKINKKEKPEELSGQVVELPPDSNARRPDKADFLSETNHYTERETVSRHRSLSKEQAGHEKTKASNIQNTKAKSLGVDEENQEELRKRELPRINKRDLLSLKLDPTGNLKNKKKSDGLLGSGKSLHISDDNKNAKESKKGAKELSLFPDQRTLARIHSAPFADAVDDVEEGEGTFLNTFEFKYAGYFNRVKRDVSNFWRPMPKLRQRDPTGKIYSHRDRKTILNVVLDNEGYVISVNIKSSCGVDFLDKEAIDAFWKVQQFPNPPKGMIKDGKIKFNFGFHITFKRRTLF